ncbi:sugar ABC transporter substrate-binding protein [bacterium RCC_150]
MSIGHRRAGLALLAAATSLALITGCSGGGILNKGAESSGASGETKTRIASLLQPADNPWVQNNIKFQKQVADALGIDLTITSDQGTDDSNVASMRALIASKPNGILFDPISEAAGKQDAQLLEDNKTVGVTEDRLVVPDFKDYKGTYLKAQVTQSNETWGYNTATSLIKGGSTKIVSILPPHGILTVETFWKGVKKALAEHPEVTLVQENWGPQSRENAIQVMQQYLTKFGQGQIDGVIAIGSTMGLGAQYAVKQAGLADRIKVATADDDPDVVKAILDGDLAITYGTHWTNGGWGLIALYDQLHGFAPKDPQPQFNLFAITKDNAKQYSDRFLSGQVLTADQIRSLSQVYNKNADLPGFIANFYKTWADPNSGLPSPSTK